MLIDELYQTALIDPIDLGGKELYIVSGYASATFANRHLTETNSDVNIKLIIGMPGKHSDHLGYMHLYERFGSRFEGYYLNGNPPVHCKAYGWFDGKKPVTGFSGSANYSQPGFFSQYQINQLCKEDPIGIKHVFNSLLDRCINILDYEPTEPISIVPTIAYTTFVKYSVAPGGVFWEIPDTRVKISFLAKDGSLPARSGLNWGQRPEQRREPNQAYLSLKGDSRDEGFLPPQTNTFTLITDDNKSFDCVVAQQGRKAIHSTFDNSELGRYIRNRIGVPFGALVTVNDLVKYGRTDFTIEKINEETFLLDLSVG
jgi:hypothetical protein